MPRTSHVTHIKSRKPSAKAESFLFSCGIIYVNLMVSSRGIPTNHTVDGGSATLRNFINRTPTSKADGSFLNIIHILLYCRLDPFLIPARLRAIALQKNRREIASASTPNLETNTFSVSISCRNSGGAINVRLAGRSGNYNLNVFPIRPVAGTTARGASVASVASVAARRSFGGGNLLVALVCLLYTSPSPRDTR